MHAIMASCGETFNAEEELMQKIHKSFELFGIINDVLCNLQSFSTASN